MAHIDGEKFGKIVQQYGYEQEVFGYVRKYVLNKYILNENIQYGKSPIIICNNTGRRFFLKKKYRCFVLRFSFWGIPEDLETGRRSFIHLSYDAAETLSFREFKRRAINKPEDAVLREAKEIINPSFDIHIKRVLR